MAESSVLYTAVYSEVDAALADLEALEQLHKADMIGKFDAAVIDKEDGEPHILAHVDRPSVRVIPGWLGAGALPRRELHEAARALDEHEAALIMVGEPTLERGFEKAITRANKTVKRDLDVAAHELAKELTDAVKG
jgi:hypothetical protein